MPTLGLLLPGFRALRPRPEPGVWWYDDLAALRASLLPGLHDVVASTDLDILHVAAEAGVPAGAWVLLGSRLPGVPEESLLPVVTEILTPWPTVARAAGARWPVYRDRTRLFRLPRTRRRTPRVLGERALDLGGAEVSCWTGRRMPKAEDAVALALAGAPLVAPRRGVLPDLVDRLGGALVEDLLGSDRELDLLRAAADGPVCLPRRRKRLPDLARAARAVFDALPGDPATLPDGWPGPIPAEGAIVLAPPELSRAAAALALECACRIVAFEAAGPGSADRYQVVPRALPRPIPPLRSVRPPRVAACLILGRPRPTLAETFRSLVGAVDEVAVVHTLGPDPAAARIAADLGIPLRERSIADWDGDLAAARNLSLDLAQADTALVIDDDERLVGPEALRSVLRAGAARCLRMPVVNVGVRSDILPQYIVRVLPLDGSVRFSGPIHEVVEGPDMRIASVGRPYLVHYGYSDPWELDRKLLARNRPLADAHAEAGCRHHRLAGTRLRDCVTQESDDLGALADAVLEFHAQVVEPGLWDELIAWGPWMAAALGRLDRGLVWTPDLPMPGGAVRRPLTLGFLRPADVGAFLDWWLANVGPRVAALHGA